MSGIASENWQRRPICIATTYSKIDCAITEPVIPSPCAALYGVSIRSDGELDNIGIGIIETGNAEAVANRLEKLAAAIRNAAKRRF